MGPTREKRLERMESQPDPPPHPGICAPLKDLKSKNPARAAASKERVAMAALLALALLTRGNLICWDLQLARAALKHAREDWVFICRQV